MKLVDVCAQLGLRFPPVGFEVQECPCGKNEDCPRCDGSGAMPMSGKTKSDALELSLTYNTLPSSLGLLVMPSTATLDDVIYTDDVKSGKKYILLTSHEDARVYQAVYPDD